MIYQNLSTTAPMVGDSEDIHGGSRITTRSPWSLTSFMLKRSTDAGTKSLPASWICWPTTRWPDGPDGWLENFWKREMGKNGRELHISVKQTLFASWYNLKNAYFLILRTKDRKRKWSIITISLNRNVALSVLLSPFLSIKLLPQILNFSPVRFSQLWELTPARTLAK